MLLLFKSRSVLLEQQQTTFIVLVIAQALLLFLFITSTTCDDSSSSSFRNIINNNNNNSNNKRLDEIASVPVPIPVPIPALYNTDYVDTNDNVKMTSTKNDDNTNTNTNTNININVDMKRLTMISVLNEENKTTTIEMKGQQKKRIKKKFWLYNVSSPTAIQDYLDLLQPMGRNRLAIFKWNSDGILDGYIGPTKIDDKQWWMDSYIQSNICFNTTSKSLYGKVAFMYVWDVMLFVLQKPHWFHTMDPPIPMFVYTIPRRDRDDGTSNPKTNDPSYIAPHLPNQNNDDTDTNESTKNASIITTNIIQIPNPYDYSGLSQRTVDSILDNHSDLLNMTYDMFHKRKNVILWRGGDHNEKIRHKLIEMSQTESTTSTTNSEQEQQKQQQVWLDAKFSNWASTDNINDGTITQEHMAVQYKYHLDVGGCSGTSWEGLRWKMCTGNLVFRIETTMVEWWYKMLQPNIHYIPIHEDLSNLKQQYDYIEQHPQDAYDIAQRGQIVCLQSYHQQYAIDTACPIFHSIQDATIEQVQEVDSILLDYYEQQKQLKSDST